MKEIRIGLLGLGVVGGGTLKVLVDNAKEISRRCGCNIVVTHAAAREYDESILDGLDQISVSNDVNDVLEHPDIDIVVELIGGYSPAREFVIQALKNGKHVVTANKALIAVHGEELFSVARTQGVLLAFEAAVGGGIPLIKAVREGLAANNIQWLAGIINGTGNFILSEMHAKGRDFSAVLKEAQALGYAEADPTFDIEGIDACHKLVILASLAFGIPLEFDKAYTEGISKVLPEDLRYAQDLGYRIKHLGIARKTDKGIEMRVHPTLIPERRLLANVDGVMNAVLVKGDMIGPTLYYGAGAGSLPTASAVVADIIDIVRVLDQPSVSVPIQAFQQHSIEHLPILPIDDVESCYYLRMRVTDAPGVLARISTILAQSGISIEAMRQYEPDHEGDSVPLIMLTHRIVEQQMHKANEDIQSLDSVHGDIVLMRMEELK